MDMTKGEDLRTKKGKETRQAILAATMEVLMEEGPKGFSASKLADRAGISKASIFHHFKSIDHVQFAVLEDMIGSFGDLMTERRPRSIAEYVDTMGRGVIEAPESMTKLSAAFAHFYIRSAHDEKFRGLQEEVTRKIVGQIERGFADVLGRPLTARERSAIPLLVAMALEGMGMFAITFRDRKQLRKAWRTIAEFVDQYFNNGRQQ